MKLKYTILLFILSFLLILPSRAENKTTITDLNINNNEANQIIFNLDSTGKFNYYIHSNQNSLLIDVKDANIDPYILSKVNYNNSNIKNIQLKKTSADINTIILDLKDIKNIKFSVNAPNGRLYPYGFNEASFKSTVNKKDTSYITKNTESKKINIPEMHNKTDESIQLKPKISFIKPDNDIQEPASLFFENNKASTIISNSNNRLNENIIVIPKELPKEELEQTKTETLNKATIEKPKQDLIIKPIPVQELINRLNSDTTEIPRLVETTENKKQAEGTKQADITLNNTNNLQNKTLLNEKNTSNDLISSIRSVPKGTFINASITNPHIITPDGSKVIEAPGNISTPPLDSEKNQTLPSINSNDSFTPRSLNSMPLGLFEEYQNVNFDSKLKLKDLKPKPNLASDGSIAFTVISADGVVEGKAPIKTLNNASNIDSKSISKKYTEISNPPKDNISIEFKKTISRGLKLQSESNFEEAEKAFEEAINQNPNQPWGYIAIANFYESQNRPQEAIKAYETALRSLPNKIELLNNIAINYYQIKNYEKAKNTLLKIISIAPSFTLAYYNLGTIYYSLNNSLKASEYLKKAVELNPVLNDAHYNLTLAYIGLQMKSEAVKQANEALSIDPDDSEFKLLLTKLK